MDSMLDIRRQDAETVIQHCGMLEWEEEVEYLRSQMTRAQVGCPGSWDTRQKKRDERRFKEEKTKEETKKKTEEAKEEVSKRKFEAEKEDSEMDENENDPEYQNKEKRVKQPKIDVMGQISVTCDARNVTLSDRIVVAASVANALGVDIDKTNISRSTAWRKGQEARLNKSREIKDNFKCPDKVVVHWDGKTLKVRGGLESKRICVYLSGMEEDKMRKLLGIPETDSGKGVKEFEVVKEKLEEWGVKEQVLGMVFDTTASNSGEHSGACRYLEEWLRFPVLWLACRRHMAELHLGTAVKLIMGATKDPGMAMFRRLRTEWRELDINLSYLELTNFSSASLALQEAAHKVLTWAKEQLAANTFPRDDYKEFMELVVVSLGGEVEGFSFKLPGPDHHARWMSKCLYILKIQLLSKIFKLSEEEKEQVKALTEYILLFYAMYWFTTPLASSAARQDLDFMSNILDYRMVNARLSFAVLSSTNRHLWYLTPQLITLALTDTGLEDSIREGMARELHSQERGQLKTGKPVFPVFSHGATVARGDMAVLVGPESWLVLDLLELRGDQDWMLASASTWPLSKDYTKLQEFTRNLTVVNDLAERGIHLATDFIRRVESEEQRHALFQVVEEFRGRVQDTSKASLKLC